MVTVKKILAASTMGALMLAASGPAGVAMAAVLGPNPTLCDGGTEPSILVRVSGLKNRAGTIRVRTFTADPGKYFDKRYTLKRLLYPVPASGPVDSRVPVSAPGVYAVYVRHDANNNDDTDRSDGVGASGNPKFSLFNIILGRKPRAEHVQVSVGNGTTIVPITVRYL